MFEYLIIVFVFQFVFAYRFPDDGFKGLFFVSLFWIITIPAILIISAVGLIKWQIEIKENNKLIGFRRPNDNWPGFAITLFKYELQIFKSR